MQIYSKILRIIKLIILAVVMKMFKKSIFNNRVNFERFYVTIHDAVCRINTDATA